MIVRVAFPISVPGLFDYSVPQEMEVQISLGVPVQVSLRKQVLWGVVIEITNHSPYTTVKPILAVKKENWTNNDNLMIKLYQWIASYYQCEMGKVFKPVTQKKLNETNSKYEERFIYSGKISVFVSRKQQEAVHAIQNLTEYKSRKSIRDEYGLSTYMFNFLKDEGYFTKKRFKIDRQNAALQEQESTLSYSLSAEQQQVFDTIISPEKKLPFLLFGITGSGKTLIYIELVKHALDQGKSAILLVPEISLTPQTIRKFQSALKVDIAVIHSKMSDGERKDSVESIVSGQKRVVIGVRSAILVPMDNVGIIIVDEEHDNSYKQSDPEPRYHARDVAVVRGKLQDTTVVLGSATPSFESYYNALNGKYTLLTLHSRFGSASLPSVNIVDMNKEHTDNNWTFISKTLQEKIETTLKEGRQIILLLNRRGFSVCLVCKDCGYTYECSFCSVNLTYHKNQMILRCHQCGYEEIAPEKCPKCAGEQIKYQGTGIQKVEEYIHHLFPKAKTIRMDQDSTSRKNAHLDIINSFSQHEADILIGTQMIAKGLNFPAVRLVGVIQADTGLHFPDFRASERTYQLLSQVAGRAGRNDSDGEVVIQTYNPKDPSILYAAEHNYESFYTNEIRNRQELQYPPFTKLVRIVITGEDELFIKQASSEFYTYIRNNTTESITMLGPVPAPLYKIKNYFRYSIIIKYTGVNAMKSLLNNFRQHHVKLFKQLKITIDIDPTNML